MSKMTVAQLHQIVESAMIKITQLETSGEALTAQLLHANKRITKLEAQLAKTRSFAESLQGDLERKEAEPTPPPASQAKGEERIANYPPREVARTAAMLLKTPTSIRQGKVYVGKSEINPLQLEQVIAHIDIPF